MGALVASLHKTVQGRGGEATAASTVFAGEVRRLEVEADLAGSRLVGRASMVTWAGLVRWGKKRRERRRGGLGRKELSP